MSGNMNIPINTLKDNMSDLLTKALPTPTLGKLVHKIGMRRLKNLQ